jgi:hypothetical protein
MENNKQDKLSADVKVSMEGGVAFIEHSDAYKAQNERYLNNEVFTADERVSNRKLIESEEAQMEAARKNPIDFLKAQQKIAATNTGDSQAAAANQQQPSQAAEFVKKLKDNLTAAGQSPEQQIEIMKLMAENSKVNAERLQGKFLQAPNLNNQPRDSQNEAKVTNESAALPPPLDIQRAVVGEGVKQLSASGSTSIEGGGFKGGVDYAQGFKHFQAGLGFGSDDQGAANINAHFEKVIPVKLPVVNNVVAYPYLNTGGTGINTDKAALSLNGGALIVKNSELDLLGNKFATATYVGGQVNQEGNVNAYANGSVALTKNFTIASGVNYDMAAKNLTEYLEVLYQVNKDVQLATKVITDEGKDNTVMETANYRFSVDGPSL